MGATRLPRGISLLLWDSFGHGNPWGEQRKLQIALGRDRLVESNFHDFSRDTFVGAASENHRPSRGIEDRESLVYLIVFSESHVNPTQKALPSDTHLTSTERYAVNLTRRTSHLLLRLPFRVHLGNLQ